MSINRVNISGNLTRDPEQRSTPAGMFVLQFSVAVNDRRKNQNGEWADYPNYVDCTMFGARAQAVCQYISKGTKVCIEGKLRWSQWEKDGQKRSKLEVIVDEIEFMSQQARQQDAAIYQQGVASYQQPQQQFQQQFQQPPSVPVFADEEIPF